VKTSYDAERIRRERRVRENGTVPRSALRKVVEGPNHNGIAFDTRWLGYIFDCSGSR